MAWRSSIIARLSLPKRSMPLRSSVSPLLPSSIFASGVRRAKDFRSSLILSPTSLLLAHGSLVDSNFSRKSLFRKPSARNTIHAEKLSRPWRLPKNQSGCDLAILESQRNVLFPALIFCSGIFPRRTTPPFRGCEFFPGYISTRFAHEILLH